ncbi:MAG: hypothetical protein H6Q67_2409 [Firmicutes bacterium]|nr:hypothetical protein [Bacillota bacterium]
MKTFGLIYHIENDNCLVHVIGAGSIVEIHEAMMEATDLKNIKFVTSQCEDELVKLLLKGNANCA